MVVATIVPIKTEKCQVLHSSVNSDARFRAFLNFIALLFPGQSP